MGNGEPKKVDAPFYVKHEDPETLKARLEAAKSKEQKTAKK